MGMLLPMALAQAMVPTVDLPPSTDDPCAAFETSANGEESRSRTITIEDLLTMADIGRASTGPAPSAFAISPDRARIAFIVKRANSDANAYCQRLVVTPMAGGGPTAEADRGGHFIHDGYPLRDFSSIRAGWAIPNTPRWSPDGASIAFLKRMEGATQVWLADPSGLALARQATMLRDDVDDFAWSPDGAGLIVATRPGLRRSAEDIAMEGLRGFLFDDRYSPQFADRPIPTGAISNDYSWVSLEDAAVRPATDSEVALLVSPRPAGVPENSRAFRASAGGYAAWLEPKFPERLLSPTRLVVSAPDGRRDICESQRCENIRDLWWFSHDDTLFIQQSTGWANSQTALLRWDREDRAPRELVVTDDVLIGCVLAEHEFVCAREGSVQSRRIVAINVATGRERVIYDPNPQFQNIRFGEVERFRFRNSYGVESFADLVLPPGHEPGERHPLIVVQYTSNGFLRGGTGDEVPIHPLAARGFAVLSFDRPDFLPEAFTATTEAEMRTAIGEDWADRRNVQSSLETALELAIGTGAIDPERMGISGFSDGSSTVQFALVNSNWFQAASMGSCCEDMYSFALAAGPRFTDFLRDMNYRYFEPGTEEFWEPMSLILNADNIDVPILIQSGDSEYEGALDVVETLSHRGKGIELYVFPDEPHFKWQPAHRRAMYERVAEWFEFWLMNRMNCDPARQEQYRRWHAMPGAGAIEDYECYSRASTEP